MSADVKPLRRRGGSATVDLSIPEVMAAGQFGLVRTVNAIAAGRHLEPGRSDLGFGYSIEGVLGELAFSIWLGVPYRPETRRPDTDRGDVAGCQVRTTARRDGSLIIRKSDPAAFPYVLALLTPHKGGGVTVTLPGWIMGGPETRTAERWRAAGSAPGIHRGAWFVAQDALLPMEALREEIEARRAA